MKSHDVLTFGDLRMDLFVSGYQRADIEGYFASCEVSGKITNPYNIINEESRAADIFVGRGLREIWPDFWEHIHHFG